MQAYSQIYLAEGKSKNKCLIHLRNCAFNEVSSSDKIYPAEGLVVTANGASCIIYVSSLRQNVEFWYKQQMAIHSFFTFLRYTTSLLALSEIMIAKVMGSSSIGTPSKHFTSSSDIFRLRSQCYNLSGEML